MTQHDRKTGRGGAKSQHVIANQLLDIIRDRRMNRGERLPEVRLADQLGVSRTPVRSALRLLVQKGIAEARLNRGFSLVKNWTELKGTILPLPISNDDDLYMLIVQERLAGNIPDNITQAGLLEQFAVNRSVLVKTLRHMSEEGLVAKNRGHGWSFMPTIDSTMALASSYAFRLTIEPAVYRLDTFRVDMVALERIHSRHVWFLEEANGLTANGRELFEIDAEFHEAMASFGGNSFFLHAVQHQNRLRRLLEYQGYWNRRRVQNWINAHLAIMDAIRANDIEAAELRMRQHLMQACRAAGVTAPSGREKKKGAAVPMGPIHADRPPPRP